MNQAVAFGLVLGGGVLLYSALHGGSGSGPMPLADVIQGKAFTPTSAGQLGSSPTPGAIGVPGQAGSFTLGGKSLSNLAGSGYYDPFAGAHVQVGRTDQGVDLTGSGLISAIGDAVVTAVYPFGSNSSGWGPPAGPGGGYVEYQLTSGPLDGAYIYVAEGIDPLVKVGEKLTAGQPVAQFASGSGMSIETGFGSGVGTATYAMEHGGYSGQGATSAGDAFRTLLADLGMTL